MRKAIVRRWAVLSLIVLCSCNKSSLSHADSVELATEENSSQQSERVMIRAKNSGIQTLNSTTVYFYRPEVHANVTAQKEDYGTLAPGDISAYREIVASYGYAPLEAIVEDKKVREGVTGFVGESAIPNGNYTYELAYGPVEWDTVNNRLYGQLIYDQTALDSAITTSLDEEITEEIALEYYPHSVLWFHCAHQQTHQGTGENGSTIVYAKVVCTNPSPKAAQRSQIDSSPPIPIRIELQEEKDSFIVSDYQFVLDQTKKSPANVFPSETLKEIQSTSIDDSTYNRLRLQSGIRDNIKVYEK